MRSRQSSGVRWALRRTRSSVSQLALTKRRVPGAIQVRSEERLAGKPVLADQLQQRILHAHAEHLFQFGNEEGVLLM